jgi:hypothetical protein
MKSVLIAICAVAGLAGIVMATPNFHDSFEAGVNGTNAWYNWRGPSSDPWPPPNPSGINNLLTTSDSHNHTAGGSKSARCWESDPAAWNAYSDFGADTGKIRAEVYLFEDYTKDGSDTSKPVTNMLSLYGDAANPGAFSDYIQLGVVSFYPGGSKTYGFRTRYNDSTGGGIINTGVSRKAGWTKLGIEVTTTRSAPRTGPGPTAGPVGCRASPFAGSAWATTPRAMKTSGMTT